MGRQLGDLEATLGEDALDLVTVGLALGSFREVEQAAVPAWDLHALEAEGGGPAGDGLQVVERRRIARELRQENGRPFDRPHRASSPVKARRNYGKSRSFAALTRDEPRHLDFWCPAREVAGERIQPVTDRGPGATPPVLLFLLACSPAPVAQSAAHRRVTTRDAGNSF